MGSNLYFRVTDDFTGMTTFSAQSAIKTAKFKKSWNLTWSHIQMSVHINAQNARTLTRGSVIWRIIWTFIQVRKIFLEVSRDGKFFKTLSRGIFSKRLLSQKTSEFWEEWSSRIFKEVKIPIFRKDSSICISRS